MPDLFSLLDVFYAEPTDCGQFTIVPAGQLPKPYDSLLSHDDHMTVTVEAFHDSLANVRVLDVKSDPSHYARKVLLHRQTDNRVVQFGIVRLNMAYLEPAVRQEIESQKTPLGRVLIKHNVLRHVELVSLWRVEPGPDLCELLESSRTTYGRTAFIHVNGEPAVELLEIVAPVEA